MLRTLRNQRLAAATEKIDMAAAASLTSSRKLTAVMQQARSEPALATDPKEFDQNKYLLNCTNGTLDLSRNPLLFRPHTADDMLTLQANVVYDPTAKCSQWEEFVLDWCCDGDKAMYRTLQQAMGLTLTGENDKQVMFLLDGPTGSGKTTLIETFTAVLGSYATSMDAEDLVVRRNAKATERKFADVPGKRMISSSETEEGDALATSMLKTLTGEDTMKARNLYREAVNFKPQAKLWLRTNDKPNIHNPDAAIMRRIVPLHFKNSVRPGEGKRYTQEDDKLRDKLLEEGSGILNWAIDGWIDYVTNGFSQARSIIEENEQYRQEQDKVQLFLDDKCDYDAAYAAIRDDLYKSFAAWCKERNFFAINYNDFRKKMLHKKFVEHYTTMVIPGTDAKGNGFGKGKRHRVWIGLRLTAANNGVTVVPMHEDIKKAKSELPEEHKAMQAAVKTMAEQQEKLQ